VPILLPISVRRQLGPQAAYDQAQLGVEVPVRVVWPQGEPLGEIREALRVDDLGQSLRLLRDAPGTEGRTLLLQHEARDEAGYGISPVGSHLQRKGGLPQYAQEPLRDHKDVGTEPVTMTMFLFAASPTKDPALLTRSLLIASAQTQGDH
jgi:hypothetical protein